MLQCTGEGATAIQRSEFDLAIRALVPRDTLDRSDRLKLSGTLHDIFAMFDRSSTLTANLAELLTGFAILCHGSKSAKLSDAFQRVFNTDGDGFLSRRELWRYLRSFLTMLFALSRCAWLCGARVCGVLPSPLRACVRVFVRTLLLWCSSVAWPLSESLRTSIHDLIDDTAVEATHLVFLSASLTAPGSKADKVSFDQFGAWYNNGGYVVLPWLELLDLKKWSFSVPISKTRCACPLCCVSTSPLSVQPSATVQPAKCDRRRCRCRRGMLPLPPRVPPRLQSAERRLSRRRCRRVAPPVFSSSSIISSSSNSRRLRRERARSRSLCRQSRQALS